MLRIKFLFVIILFLSPMSLLAKSDTSLDFLTKLKPKDEAKLSKPPKPLAKMGSSEAGFSYST